MRILLVEDNQALSEGLSALLRGSGYAVDVVSGGASADAAIAAENFDLVILDLNLPEIDGIEVLRAMRARKDKAAVMILTARGAPEERVKGLDLGADDYMIKPFDITEFEARVRLQAALDALRHFTGNASHQLRTPLAIIGTQLALAARAGSLEEAQAAAQKGSAFVAQAEHILAQLLRMATIDAVGSRKEQVFAAIDLVGVARNVTADFVPRAAEAGIDLGFEGEGEAAIFADPLLIGELIGNLVGNAVNYAGRGAEVTVRVGGEAGGVWLEVEDDGPGIAADKRAMVRQRFARGAANAAPGAGLGLAIVEEIAALFGGRLTLQEGAGGRGLKARVEFFRRAGA